MGKDIIIDELRKLREEHAAQFHYDLDAIFKDLKNKEMKNKSKKVSFKPKKYFKPTGTV